MGVEAPNLAKLASEGMVFNNTYCQAAVCSPTRNSFMSKPPRPPARARPLPAYLTPKAPPAGRRPDSTRIWNFQGSFRDVGVDKSGKKGEDWMSLPETFKAAVRAPPPLCAAERLSPNKLLRRDTPRPASAKRSTPARRRTGTSRRAGRRSTPTGTRTSRSRRSTPSSRWMSSSSKCSRSLCVL